MAQHMFDLSEVSMGTITPIFKNNATVTPVSTAFYGPPLTFRNKNILIISDNNKVNITNISNLKLNVITLGPKIT